MKILIFSDTHRRTERMAEILTRSRASTDLVIHLGDCYGDIAAVRDDFPEIAFLGVCGNCDLFVSRDYPEISTVSLEGRRLLFTHGHRFHIRENDDLLLYEAKKAGADIVLYGHTHVGALYEKNGVTFFNPGSLTEPRDGKSGSYGVLTLDAGKAEFKHVTL